MSPWVISPESEPILNATCFASVKKKTTVIVLYKILPLEFFSGAFYLTSRDITLL